MKFEKFPLHIYIKSSVGSKNRFQFKVVVSDWIIQIACCSCVYVIGVCMLQILHKHMMLAY